MRAAVVGGGVSGLAAASALAVRRNPGQGFLQASRFDRLAEPQDRRLPAVFGYRCAERLIRALTIRMNGAEPEEAYLGNFGSNLGVLLDTFDQPADGMGALFERFAQTAPQQGIRVLTGHRISALTPRVERFGASVSWVSETDAGSVAFYFLFLYVFRLPYESPILRGFAVLLCLSALWLDRWPKAWARWLPVYWHFGIVFVLLFISTFYLLENGLHELWRYWYIFMVFVLIGFVPNWFAFLCDLMAGILAAAVLYALSGPHPPIVASFDLALWVLVVFFTAAAGYLFSYSNLQGQIAAKRDEAIQTIAASMAHEMRNPLSQVCQTLGLMEREMARCEDLPGQARSIASQVTSLMRRGQMATGRGLQTIDMILREVSHRPIAREELAVLRVSEVTRKALNEYAYESDRERIRVHLDDREDFWIRADETLYVYILFNLLKNALYYMGSHRDAGIAIRLELGRSENRVVFRDTGPGIAPENMAHLFEGFFTAGKRNGIGLGLAYCQRTMRAFGGDIRCQSRLGEYTEFTLTFPAVPAMDAEEARSRRFDSHASRFGGRRILVVDDALTARALVCDTLAPLGCLVDQARGFEDAAKLLQAHCYDLAILDLNMPGEGGDTLALSMTSGWLGKAAKRVPIVCYSAEPPAEALPRALRAGMQTLIPKIVAGSDLVDMLARYLCEPTLEDEASWDGRRVLAIDDSAINRDLIQSLLESWGLSVEQAADGEEALAILDERSFDLILTDLCMPAMGGIEMCRRLRAHPVNDRQRIPVVALSARDDEQTRREAARAGIAGLVPKPLLERPTMRLLLFRRFGGAPRSRRHRIPPVDLRSDPAAVAGGLPGHHAPSERERMGMLARHRETFVCALPAQAQELRGWWERGETNPVAFHAHRLIGTASMLQLRELAEQAALVERVVHVQRIEEAGLALDGLCEEMRRLGAASAVARVADA